MRILGMFARGGAAPGHEFPQALLGGRRGIVLRRHRCEAWVDIAERGARQALAALRLRQRRVRLHILSVTLSNHHFGHGRATPS